MLSASDTCVIDPTSNYQFLYDDSIDFNRDYRDDYCGIYSYHGSLFGAMSGRFRDSRNINTPHYSLRIIMWVILIDDWVATDGITIDDVVSGLTKKQDFTTISTSENICGGPELDHYMKLDLEFPNYNPNDDVYLNLESVNANNN